MKQSTETILASTFGQLTPIEEVKKKGVRHFRCKCTCGALRMVRLGDLNSGATKSCGCLRDKVNRSRKMPGMINHLAEE